MKIQIVAYGIAKDILRQRKLTMEMTDGHTLGALRESLFRQYPEFGKLKSVAFAVGDEYRKDEFPLHEGAEVAIIPPVSGG